MAQLSVEHTLDGVPDAAGGGNARATGAPSRSSRAPNHRTVLFVTNTCEFGGAEKHLLELVRRLLGSDVQISILCLDKDLYTEHLSRDEAAQVVIVRLEKRPNTFWEWYRTFRNLRTDVVVLVWAWLWCYEWYVSVAAWLAGVPRRVSIAHLTPPPVDGWREGQRVTLLMRARRAYRLFKWRVSAHFDDTIVCVSNAVRNALLTNYRFPEKKTVTIHNGIGRPKPQPCKNTTSEIRTKLGLDSAEFVLVCVARLSEQKRVDLLLEAMARVLRENLSCKCIIVGDGPLRGELLRQALTLGLTGHVFFEGFQRNVQPYLRASNAFVLSSDREGLPLAILEAMSFGLPCIVTNVGGNAEAIIDGVHGLVVPAGSVEALATAICSLVNNRRDVDEMSKRAKARSYESFNLDERMAELKSTILDSNPSK